MLCFIVESIDPNCSPSVIFPNWSSGWPSSIRLSPWGRWSLGKMVLLENPNFDEFRFCDFSWYERMVKKWFPRVNFIPTNCCVLNIFDISIRWGSKLDFLRLSFFFYLFSTVFSLFFASSEAKVINSNCEI
jgi:hypothetical protein